MALQPELPFETKWDIAYSHIQSKNFVKFYQFSPGCLDAILFTRVEVQIYRQDHPCNWFLCVMLSYLTQESSSFAFFISGSPSPFLSFAFSWSAMFTFKGNTRPFPSCFGMVIRMKRYARFSKTEAEEQWFRYCQTLSELLPLYHAPKSNTWRNKRSRSFSHNYVLIRIESMCTKI